MLHDLVIVGAGPVGATLALALFDSDLDVVALDARPAGSIARSDRSLALSHGTRLVFERLGVWSGVTATAGAVTPLPAPPHFHAGAVWAPRRLPPPPGRAVLRAVLSD